MALKSLSKLLAIGWLALLIIASVTSLWFGPDPLAVDLGARLIAPSGTYWLGTDELGRSVLTRLLHAARFTLTITVAATVLSLSFGAVLGLLAGWYGRYIDRVVNGLIGLFWSVPFPIFAVLTLAVVGSRVSALILVIAGVNWVSSARVFRAEAQRLRHSTFVRSARALGFPAWRLLWIHLFPNLRGTTLALAGFGAAETLALESGLAFLGLSLPPPSPTWGGIMANGLDYLTTGWWIALMPAIFVTITLASFRVLAYCQTPPHTNE